MLEKIIQNLKLAWNWFIKLMCLADRHIQN